jgi:hypothetical protein
MNKLSVVAHVYSPSYVGDIGRRITVWSQSHEKKFKTLSEKVTKARKRMDMAKLVEHLPSLASIRPWGENHITTKKQTKKSKGKLV